MNRKKLLPLFFLATIIFSCNLNTETAATDSTAIKTQQSPSQIQDGQLPVAPDDKTQLPDSAPPSNQPKTIVPIDWDKKIIKTATLKFEVKDFKNYSADVYRIVKQYGGYIAGEDQSQTDEKQETTITIKVPVGQFEQMINLFSERDVKVMERKISTDDVGSQIVDTKSRLEAKRAMHTKYLEFFKEAKNMDEVLRVQSDINSLQETMESAAGRIHYLNQQSAMSTIVLTFYQPLEGFKPEQSPSFLTRISEAFKTGGSWMGNILVGLISVWPLLLLIALGVFAVKKFSTVKTKQPNA